MDTSRRPLIILGAGASYDFVHPEQRKGAMPPLVDHLIKQQNLDYPLIQNYKEVGDLFSRIAPAILRKERPRSFEESIREVLDSTQVVGLRFYLSDYFYRISTGELLQQYVNNYRALIGYIQRGEAKGADVISFNYDTLFEHQLLSKERNFLEMNDYTNIKYPIRILKVHGSASWVHIRKKSAIDRSLGVTNSYEFIKNNPEFTSEVFYTRRKIGANSSSSDFYLIPALMPPTVGLKSFVCPKEHLDSLDSILNEVSRILIIGWKVGDQQLLSLLREKIQYKIPVFIVCGPEGSQDIEKNLAFVPNLEIEDVVREFSNFIDSPMADTFFGTKIKGNILE